MKSTSYIKDLSLKHLNYLLSYLHNLHSDLHVSIATYFEQIIKQITIGCIIQFQRRNLCNVLLSAIPFHKVAIHVVN